MQAECDAKSDFKGSLTGFTKTKAAQSAGGG